MPPDNYQFLSGTRDRNSVHFVSAPHQVTQEQSMANHFIHQGIDDWLPLGSRVRYYQEMDFFADLNIPLIFILS
jgi:hypothetical protein